MLQQNTENKEPSHNFIKKIINFYNETKWIFLAFFLFAAFHTVIESFLNKILIDPILSEFKDNCISKIALVFIIIISIIKTSISCKKNKHISLKHLICLILPTLIYIYYANLSDFIPLEKIYDFKRIGNSSISYLDVIIYSIILPSFFTKIIVKIKQCNKKSQKDSLLQSDDPIKQITEDILGRSTAAKSIAQLLHNKMITKNNSFTFAITSKWGNGKTSFINLIIKQLNELNKNKYIPFEFQAWKISTPANITSVFFNELGYRIKPFHSNLTDDIINYGQIITNNSKSSLLSIINNICSRASNKTIEDKFDSINTKLVKTDKKIIIIIDDLDRLDGNEIFSLLKIMRNSAYFKSMLFITAFDEDYIIEALKNIKIPKPKQYIEKIFQSKYALITPDKKTITNILRTKLLSIIIKEQKTEQDIEDIKQFDFNSINEVSSVRDVNLLLNIFILSFKTLKGYVSIVDLLYISILKYKYQVAYFYFAENIEKHILNRGKRILYTKEKNTKYDEFTNKKSPKEDIQITIKKEFSKNAKSILSIIAILFNNKNTHPFSFTLIPNINLYFTDNPQNKYSSIDYIKSLFNQNLQYIIKEIHMNEDIGNSSLLNFINNSNIQNLTKDKINKYIYSIFEICQDISIFYYPFSILKKLVEKYPNQSKTTFSDLIEQKYYCKNICRYFNYEIDDNPNFIYTREEALKISYSFFKTEYEEENLHNMYYYYHRIKDFDTNQKIMPLIINDFKDLILRKPEKILPTYIQGDKDPDDKISYSISSFLRNLWDNNIADLKKEFSNSKSPIINEFFDFHKNWQQKNSNNINQETYIPYDFKYIKIPPENIH